MRRQSAVWLDALESLVATEPARSAGLLLYYEDREDASIELDGFDSLPLYTPARTVGIRATTAFGKECYRSDPTPDEAADLTGVLTGARPTPRYDARQPVSPTESRIETTPGVERLREILACLSRELPAAVARALWVGFDQEVLVASPDFGVRYDRRRGSRIAVEATLRVGSCSSSAAADLSLSGVGACTATPREIALALASRLHARLGAVPGPPGPTTIVTAPGIAGVIVHELVGHALEADSVLAGCSWLAGHSEVASAELTVIDDPRLGRAAWRIDDEGEASGPTPLLCRGQAVGSLHDRETARRCGAKPSGHGRRSSFRDPVRPRMGCTYVTTGEWEAAEVLRDTAHGIYVRRMRGAATDPKTGRAVFRVTDADLIRGGRLERPLQAMLLVLHGREALRGVDRVARDLAFDTCIGSCSREGQALASSVGGPTIRLGVATVLA